MVLQTGCIDVLIRSSAGIHSHSHIDFTSISDSQWGWFHLGSVSIAGFGKFGYHPLLPKDYWGGGEFEKSVLILILVCSQYLTRHNTVNSFIYPTVTPNYCCLCIISISENYTNAMAMTLRLPTSNPFFCYIYPFNLGTSV